MRWAVLGLAVALAGCTGSAPAAPAEGPIESAGVSTGASTVLWDTNVSFQNPPGANPPTAEANEFPVGSFEVPANASGIKVEFHRHHVSLEAFAANCRLYRDGSLLDQDAFSDGQLGRYDSEGTCTLSFEGLDEGLYDAVYLADKWDPMGRHDIRVRVEARQA